MLESTCFTCEALPVVSRALLQGTHTHWALNPWRPPWVAQRSSRGGNCERRKYPKTHSCPQHPSPTDSLLACLLFTPPWLFLFPPLTFSNILSVFLAPEPKHLPTFQPLELELCIKPDMNSFCDTVTTESKLDGHIVLTQIQPPPGPAEAVPLLVPRLPGPAQPWPGSIQVIRALQAPLRGGYTP